MVSEINNSPQPILQPTLAVTTTSAFDEALALVLKYEGGYTDNPADHGGATNKGIIQREYNDYRIKKGKELQSVKFIDDIEVHEIYSDKYWMLGKCQALPEKLGIVHFDSCVNCGISQASKFLQRSIARFSPGSVSDDGIIGPLTLRKLISLFQTVSEHNFILEYLNNRSQFYYKIVERDPSQRVFIKGWQNRITNLAAYVNDKAIV